MNNDEGFIIISADDVAVPVLGYSENGSYDDSNPNFSYWMECLSQEIASAIENNTPQSAEIKAKWDAYLNDNATSLRASTAAGVSPLIQTQWNQDTPYNSLCPTVNGTLTATGCVATAMAQIMKFWNYPTTGTGSNTYTPPNSAEGTSFLPITVDFGNTTYDWTDMTNTYTTSSTSQQKSAVATLMYHCGVSVNMQYDLASSVGSGAYNEDVGPALVKYFNYDAGVNILYRDDYSYSAWTNILKTELDAGRPVLYGGQGTPAGHSFVCDGYDSDNLYHFNWGWSGVSDGYYQLWALNPPALGIGGFAGGFNSEQSAVVGIQPNINSPAPIILSVDSLTANVPSLTNITQAFNINALSFFNLGSYIDSLNIGLLLCEPDNSPINYQKKLFQLDLGQDLGCDACLDFYTDYSLPPTLPVGVYKLYLAYSTIANPDTPIVIPGYYMNGNNFLRVQVNGDGTVLLSNGATNNTPDFTLASLTAAGTLYQNKTGNFIATVSNNGLTDYNSQMAIQLNGTVYDTESVVIPSGTTQKVEFSGLISLPPGTYPSALSLWYDPNNNQSAPTVQLGSFADVKVASPSNVMKVRIIILGPKENIP